MAWHCAELHSTAQHCTALHSTAQHCTAWHGIGMANNNNGGRAKQGLKEATLRAGRSRWPRSASRSSGRSHSPPPLFLYLLYVFICLFMFVSFYVLIYIYIYIYIFLFESALPVSPNGAREERAVRARSIASPSRPIPLPSRPFFQVRPGKIVK